MGTVWSILAVLTLAAPPEVEVADTTGCVTAQGVLGQLASEVGDLDLTRLLVRVEVEVTVSGRLSVWLKVTERERERVLAKRHFALAPSECAMLPRVFAAVIYRRLVELPRQEWNLRRDRAAAVGRRPRAGPAPPPPPPPEPPTVWSLGWDAALGASVGLGPVAPQGHLEVGVEPAVNGKWGFPVGVTAQLGAPQDVGGGAGQLVGVAAYGGVSRTFTVGGVRLAPYVTTALGVRTAWGVDFADNRGETVPLFDTTVGLKARLGSGPFGALGARALWIVPRLRQAGDPALHEEPRARLEVLIGYGW